MMYNAKVNSNVQSLVVGDVSGYVAPLNSNETLVVFRTRSDTVLCSEVCVDLLLSGQVKAYAAGRIPNCETAPAPNARILVHQLVRAPGCGDRKVSIRNEAWKMEQAGTAAFALAAAEARGMCVRSTESTLDRVTSPRVVALLRRDNLDYPESALFIGTLMRVSRAAVFDHSNEGDVSPVFQDTKVSYSLLRPLLAVRLKSSI